MINADKIIVIMTDTQRWDMLGCYGNKDMKTPNLDRLASEGMRFDKAYTTQPVCGPARSAIFTGTYPHTNGSWGNSIALGDNVKTIGQRLRDNGLQTAYIGKWHLDGSDYFGLGKCPDGWNENYWYDMRNYLEELTDDERRISRDDKLFEKIEVTEDFTFGHRCSNRAIDFLEKFKDDKFFLTVSYDEPHGPCLCPEPYYSMYNDYHFPKSKNVWDNLDDKPEHQQVWSGNLRNADKDALNISEPAYLGCNSFVDYEIGRVLSAIDKYAPDALVIYTSDHGYSMYSHSINNKGPVMYDEICKIPFIVRWKGVIENGCVSTQAISHIDIAPTIMEAAGLPVPKMFEGKSLSKMFVNKHERINDLIFIEFGRYEIGNDGFGGFQPIRAVFDGRHKLVINLLTTDELYDLDKDPDEMINLINSDESKCIRDSLHDSILEWMNSTRDPFRGYYWERRPWRLDARPASWVYTGMFREKENEEYEPRPLDYSTGVEIVATVIKK